MLHHEKILHLWWFRQKIKSSHVLNNGATKKGKKFIALGIEKRRCLCLSTILWMPHYRKNKALILVERFVDGVVPPGDPIPGVFLKVHIGAQNYHWNFFLFIGRYNNELYINFGSNSSISYYIFSSGTIRTMKAKLCFLNSFFVYWQPSIFLLFSYFFFQCSRRRKAGDNYMTISQRKIAGLTPCFLPILNL